MASQEFESAMDPGKSFPFLAVTMLLAALLGAAFIYLSVCLNQREIAGARLFLVQQCRGRLAAAEERDLRPERSGPPAADRVSERLLSLLRTGGSYGGRRIHPLQEPELKALLNTVLARPGRAGFRRQLESLAAALEFRLVAGNRRVRVALRLLALAGIFFGLAQAAWFFDNRRQREHLVRRLQGFSLRAAMLQALPEAWILLDRKLVVRAATDEAGKSAGIAAGSGTGFETVCRDPQLLAELRRVTSSIELHPVGRIRGLPESARLENRAGGRPREVVISWFRVVLDGRNYLLGRIDSTEPEVFENSDSQFLRRLRELAKKVFKVQDEERRRLADELHDGLCQALAVLKMQVSAVERRVDDEELREECSQARRFVSQIIEDVRRLSHDLSPVVLDDLGLSKALVHLVNNFTATHNLKALTSVPDIDDCFSEEEARNIYRIVQEAINNVGKHARASQMVLEVNPGASEIVFRIRDDGVGFDPSRLDGAASRPSLGLTSMAQRVQLLGGRFEVVGRPGQGTEIKFILPKSCRPQAGRLT